MQNLNNDISTVQNFSGNSLTGRISEIEKFLVNKNQSDITQYLFDENISGAVINSGISLKNFLGQIHVVIHAAGILLTLPKILKENEIIVSLSLGAGNTGKDFDLETNLRVAEFKFIAWKGGPESIRQNALFKDFYLLAESNTIKQKELYVIGMEKPLKFFNGNRSINSVLSRNNKLLGEYKAKYQDNYKVVSEYYIANKNKVELIDLAKLIPEINQIIEPSLLESL